MKDHADQSTILTLKPLSNLVAPHEAGGKYVLLAPSAHRKGEFDLVAENLTQAHAQAICDAVNGRCESEAIEALRAVSVFASEHECECRIVMGLQSTCPWCNVASVLARRDAVNGGTK